MVANGVARKLKKFRTSKGDYWIIQAVILFNYIPFQDRNFSERKEFAPRGSEFFPLRAVPYGMENHFTTLDDLP